MEQIIRMVKERSWEFTIGLFFIFAAMLLMKHQIDAVTLIFIDHRSEYTLIEQTTKFSLMLAMVFCLLCLKFENDVHKLFPATFMMAAAFTIYLSESNMIKSYLQPFFGACLILPCLYYLMRERYYMPLALFVIGLGFITLGYLDDLVGEVDSVKELVPVSFYNLLENLSEENLDTFGACFIGLSGCALSGNILRLFWQSRPSMLFMILVACLLVAWGNGFSHYQYKPGMLLLSFGTGLSMLGMLMLLKLRRSVDFLKLGGSLYSVTEYRFDAFLLFFFVVMPAVMRHYNYAVGIFIWSWLVYVSWASYRRAMVRLQTAE